jgi:hypothetical protein
VFQLVSLAFINRFSLTHSLIRRHHDAESVFTLVEVAESVMGAAMLTSVHHAIGVAISAREDASQKDPAVRSTVCKFKSCLFK